MLCESAAAIYLARNGTEKEKIKDYIEDKYGYDLSRALDEIRLVYQFNETCQETVPEAIIAFLESHGFEDAIRNAISIGGDSDTLAAITGSIAEAAYRIESGITTEVFYFLDDTLSAVINTKMFEWMEQLWTNDAIVAIKPSTYIPVSSISNAMANSVRCR